MKFYLVFSIFFSGVDERITCDIIMRWSTKSFVYFQKHWTCSVEKFVCRLQLSGRLLVSPCQMEKCERRRGWSFFNCRRTPFKWGHCKDLVRRGGYFTDRSRNHSSGLSVRDSETGRTRNVLPLLLRTSGADQKCPVPFGPTDDQDANALNHIGFHNVPAKHAETTTINRWWEWVRIHLDCLRCI